MLGFEVLLKCVITRFGPLTIETSIEKSAFHLLFILPKSCKLRKRTRKGLFGLLKALPSTPSHVPSKWESLWDVDSASWIQAAENGTS